MDFLATDAQAPRGGVVNQPGWLADTGPRDRRPPAQLESRFDAARRGWRVALAWTGNLLVLLFGLAIATALFRSALTGEPMPDLSAGLAPMALPLATLLFEQYNRHAERKAGVA